MCVWILVFLCALPSPVLSRQTQTTGASGVLCGDTKCLKHKTQCVNGTCFCKPPFDHIQSLGDFSCHRKNKVVARITGDPVMETFDKKKYNVHLPCRYMVTHFTSALRVNHSTIGRCECQLHQWNKKFKGKMYPAGFDVACKLMNTKGTAWTESASVMKDGTAANGVYNFREWGAEDYLPNGPFTETPVDIDRDGVRLRCFYDQKNNWGKFQLKNCGLEIGLRPLDTVIPAKDQVQRNGIYWSINCAHQISFKSNSRVMATAPEQHDGVEFLDSIIPGLTAPQSFLFRALTSHIPQTQPDAAPECTTLANVAHSCDTTEKKQRAMTWCEWMFKRSLFLKCIDRSNNANNNGNNVLHLMRRCFQAACSNGLTCSEFADDIRNSRCTNVRKTPEVQAWVRGDYCI